jgi:hypothetical protein
MLESIVESYDALCHDPRFGEGWGRDDTVPDTRTKWCYTPLVGKGKDRQVGGLWRFANAYIEAERGNDALLKNRSLFFPSNDFQFYTWGDWLAGQRRLLVAAKAKSNPDELLGELANLLNVRCPFKFLFIGESANILERLNAFCGDPANSVKECAGTTYLVAEIPRNPSRPDTWRRYRADVDETERLSFRAVG